LLFPYRPIFAVGIDSIFRIGSFAHFTVAHVELGHHYVLDTSSIA
jgi:hypothetical protein